jgi:hypothetical protein
MASGRRRVKFEASGAESVIRRFRMTKVPLVLAGMMASARALSFVLRFTRAEGRAATVLVVGMILFTATLLAVVLLWGQ